MSNFVQKIRRDTPASKTGSRTPTSSALLLGNYRPTLSAAEAISKLGFKTIVTYADDGAAGAKYSRFVDEIWRHSDCQNSSQFEQDLMTFLNARPDISVIFPIEERYAVWISEFQSRLPKHVLVVSPDPEIVRTCLDKPTIIELASGLGIPCLPNTVVYTLSELTNAAEKIGYPIIIRPFTQYTRVRNKKAVICNTKQALLDLFPSWPKNQPGLLVQQYLTGDRRDLYFIADHGRILSFLETKITRTDSFDGTGLSTEGQYVEVSPALAEDTTRLVEALGYHGVGFSQFIVNDTRQQRNFLELNPRLAGSNKCTEALGMDLTSAAFMLAKGSDLSDRTNFRYSTGGYYCWLSGDLYGLKEAIKMREISAAQTARWTFDMLRSLLRSRVHLTWSWYDPKPATMLFIRQTFRALGSRR